MVRAGGSRLYFANHVYAVAQATKLQIMNQPTKDGTMRGSSATSRDAGACAHCMTNSTNCVTPEDTQTIT